MLKYQATRSLLLCAIVLAQLAGCSANHNTAFRLKELESNKTAVVAFDAKQRAILKSDEERFCSEPSPDVFSVMAQAFSGGASFGKSADPKALNAALNLAFSSAEQGSTIPRTQTINMLRELMFRTCERYLNGGYNANELPIQAVRDQRLMVSILAIEQLTGAILPKPVAISATGQASQDSTEALIRLDDARKELDAAIEGTAKAEKAFANEDGDAHTCKHLDEVVAQGTALAGDDAKKKAACDASSSALNRARDRETRAREHHADLQRLSAGVGGSVATQTSGSTAGGIDQGREIAEVSFAVREIVSRNFEDGTEVMLFCLRNMVFEPPKASNSKDLTDKQKVDLQNMCVRYLSTLIEARSAANEAKAEALLKMNTVSTDLFDQYWPTLEPILNDNSKRAELVQSIRGQLTPSQRSKADCFTANKSKDEIRACFMTLPNQLKRDLAGAK